MENASPTGSAQRKFSLLQVFLVVIGIFLAFGVVFGGGIFLGKELAAEKFVSPKNQKTIIAHITPEPTIRAQPTGAPQDPQVPETSSNSFLPGKGYYSDTVFAIQQADPHITAIATASRLEGQDDQYTQDSRVTFFD